VPTLGSFGGAGTVAGARPNGAEAEMGAERDRVAAFGRPEDGLRDASDWYLWGPYVSERQWGTVREDYSAGGDAWNSFPHDHARSRAYRWGEDALAGFCDVEQRMCLGLALWNGADPVLKERLFGLAGPEGNHGEDAKEYWWYLDAVPSHAWNRWRYHYPQAEFPYGDLVATNARRGRYEMEYELLDTGVFDGDRYWIVDVDYAKASPLDLLVTVRVTNAGPDAATLHVLPTAWFRNTWAWGDDETPPRLRAADEATVLIDHPVLGELELVAASGPDGVQPRLLFCENETNTARLYGVAPLTPYPKDGINDHVVGGAASVNPEGHGTKCAFWFTVDVDAAATVELRLRLRPRAATPASAAAGLGTDFEDVRRTRLAEADEFYADLAPEGTTADEAAVMRQAFAGMLWGKQFFYYDVSQWLSGDPGQPPPPPERWRGRNQRWRAFSAFDIMSMPDPWEYPWFAAWDLAFHCVALAHVDPAFAKYQLVLLCREWFQHGDGALPAYEWSFDDVNPPVQAWAALEVFVIDGARDLDFLERVFDKLLINFTWWVNHQSADDTNLFSGGFLGLDNIGPLDRSNLPVKGSLTQADATAWMAAYALTMGAMATILYRSGRPTVDLTVKFLEHFTAITRAMARQDLWDEADGFFYDRLNLPDGSSRLVQVRSMVGVLPLLASIVLDERAIQGMQRLGKQFAHLLDERMATPEELRERGVLRGPEGDRRMLLGVVGLDRLRRVLNRVVDEDEFLSPYGLRSLSRAHRDAPYRIDVEGLSAVVDYEPAESTTSMFGGNSNWRGPVWMPLNHLLLRTLEMYGRFFGDDVTIEYPARSGNQSPFTDVAADLRRRLVSLFLVDAHGRRPCFGGVERMQTDPRWKDNVLFHEYFHGDVGAGLGASHQTGWTGLVADLIVRRPGSGAPTLASLWDLG
jgi:hypothetical protein